MKSAPVLQPAPGADSTDRRPAVQKVCAWCETSIGVISGPAAEAEAPSHGLCHDCILELLRSLRDRPRPRRRPRRRRLVAQG